MKVISIKKFLTENVIKGFVILCIGYAMITQLLQMFARDEVEHLHSSMLLSLGKTPYVDFFQHHHPLLWYVIFPIFRVFGYSANALVVVKIFFIFLGIFNLFLVFQITHYYFRSLKPRLLAVLMVLSSNFFLSSGMEIRPDTPMITFMLLSLLALLHYFRSNSLRLLFVSGICIAISFLFLQKTVLLLACFNVLIFIYLWKFQRNSYKDIVTKLAIFNAGIFIPFTLFIIWMVRMVTWERYYFLNWTVNFNFDDKFNLWEQVGWFGVQYNVLFILLFPAFVLGVWQLKKKINDIHYLTLVATATFSLLFLFLARSPHHNYFLPSVMTNAVLIVMFLQFLFDRWNNIYPKLIILSILIFPPFYWMYTDGVGYLIYQLKQMELMRYLPEKERERVDILDEYNIYYVNHGYYWYSPNVTKTIKNLEYKGMVPDSIEKPE